MKEKLRLAVFGHKRWSREGGVEIVVKELCTRMAQQGCQVTCYNRAGHGVQFCWKRTKSIWRMSIPARMPH